jgi:tripartite-type tricarboxylate transporter receptor subunit TctC
MGLLNPLRALCACAAGLAVLFIAGAGRAEEAVSFQGKTLTMLIGAEAGGGTDIFGRIIAPFLSNALPGKPAIVPRNMPGANGIVALNYFVKQVAPDGYTFVVGSGTQVDPFTYHFSNAQYDLTKFEHVGGAGRSGTALIINQKALPRLTDKSQPPVTMGALSAVRSGMMMTLWGGEYLGWNVKWVIGYRGANELLLALSRGEIDMTSMAIVDQIETAKKSGNFDLIAQSGTVENGKMVLRPEFGNTPAMATMVEDKITDPVAQKAFAHWKAIITVGQWLALPPGTPQRFTDTYRAAFKKVFADPEFRKQMLKVDSGTFEVSPEDMLATVTVLSSTPPESLTFLEQVARRQGLSGFQ